MSLPPVIEQADRDDYALEVFAQLGEIYLVPAARRCGGKHFPHPTAWRYTPPSVRVNDQTWPDRVSMSERGQHDDLPVHPTGIPEAGLLWRW